MRLRVPGFVEELRRVRITAVRTRRLEWAVGLEVSLPVSLLRSLVGSADVSTLDLRPFPPLHQNGLADSLRLRAAFTEQPLVSRLPFSYQRVPPKVRWLIARNIGSRLRTKQQSWAKFPDWPLDLSADFASDWSATDPDVPAPQPAPVLLTHDIDSPEGLRNLVELFLPVEEAAGARSTNYVVPCGWQLDHGLLREVIQRGHEIGVHGYDHSNRTAFLSATERRQRLTDGRAALEAYAPSGYRAPSLVRTSELVEDLADYYRYDSSIPTSGGPFPVFNNGCASARPFRIDRTLEIPITLRRDGSVQFLGYTPQEIGAMWEQNAETIATARGVVMLLTHCEKRFSGNRPMLDTYRRFLEFARCSPRFEWSTASRVAAAAGPP
jgi:peptidoglycan/xylan/chitin deacetylase (PgdA/CDA1 family)